MLQFSHLTVSIFLVLKFTTKEALNLRPGLAQKPKTFSVFIRGNIISGKYVIYKLRNFGFRISRVFLSVCCTVSQIFSHLLRPGCWHEKSEAQASLALIGLPSQLVGTVLVVELQETQQRTTLVTFLKSKTCTHKSSYRYGDSIIFYYSIYILITFAIIDQIAFKLDHQVVETDQLVVILKLS